LDDLLAAAASRERAITGASQDDGARSWGRWKKWCESVGCDDLYLNQCSQIKRNLLLGAIAMAIRERRFLLNRTDALVEGTVRGAISHVVQAFRESGRQNPTKDADNMLSVLLLRQFRAYKRRSQRSATKGPSIYCPRRISKEASIRARYRCFETNYLRGLLRLSFMRILKGPSKGNEMHKATLPTQY
jgi:hypothetical protein